MASMAGNLYFLTQFIRFQGLLFLDAISWIFLSKNDFFVLLTVSLNIFQSKLDLDEQYMFSFLLYSLFHYALKHLVILTHLEYLFQRFSEIAMNSCTILSSNSLSGMLVVLMLPTMFLISLIKPFSSTLFLIMVHHLSWINSLLMMMLTVKEA